jgi:predicted transcriptional regulator
MSMVDDPKVNGRALRRMRQRAGLIQKELAAEAGLDPTTVSRLGTGERNRAYFSTMKSIAGALSNAMGRPVTLDDLMVFPDD